MTIHVVRHLFTVDEYYKMAQAGILHEDDRVELLEGEIVEMAPIGSRHAALCETPQPYFLSEFGRACHHRRPGPRPAERALGAPARPDLASTPSRLLLCFPSRA